MRETALDLGGLCGLHSLYCLAIEVTGMGGEQLQLQYDQDDHAVWLVVSRVGAGRPDQELLRLREGFGLEQVRQALLATGWVHQHDDDLWLKYGLDLAVVQDVAQRMLDYFETPAEPRSMLLEVQAAVEAYDAVQQDEVHIPLIAYAWLDIMVREDLADEARSAKRIWTDPALVIEIESHSRRRVDELCKRYASRPPMRMAPSKRKRHPESGENFA